MTVFEYGALTFEREPEGSGICVKDYEPDVRSVSKLVVKYKLHVYGVDYHLKVHELPAYLHDIPVGIGANVAECFEMIIVASTPLAEMEKRVAECVTRKKQHSWGFY